MEPFKVTDLKEIQEDILINGFSKKNEIFWFFTIKGSPRTFCKNVSKVKFATGEDIKDLRSRINKEKEKVANKVPKVKAAVIREAKANIAFTSAGLAKVRMTSILSILN